MFPAERAEEEVTVERNHISASCSVGGAAVAALDVLVVVRRVRHAELQRRACEDRAWYGCAVVRPAVEVVINNFRKGAFALSMLWYAELYLVAHSAGASGVAGRLGAPREQQQMGVALHVQSEPGTDHRADRPAT